MSNIAVIGLGNMGAGMAARLLAAGHSVRVYNRTAERAEPLLSAGALPAKTPKDACSAVDAVFSMVTDDAASQAVWLGADGILASSPAAGAFAVECSTLSHAWVTDLATNARARGFRYLDAPVTGLPDAAAAGTLTLLVGAALEDLRDARHLLEPLATRILRFGEVGGGTAYKLIINMIGAVQIASVAEGIAVAERAGLDLAVVADALATSQAASPQVVRNARRMFDGDHDCNVVFTPALRYKDVDYALRLAQSLAIGSPFGALAASMFGELKDSADADANESKVIEIARRQKPAAS